MDRLTVLTSVEFIMTRKQNRSSFAPWTSCLLNSRTLPGTTCATFILSTGNLFSLKLCSFTLLKPDSWFLLIFIPSFRHCHFEGTWVVEAWHWLHAAGLLVQIEMWVLPGFEKSCLARKASQQFPPLLKEYQDAHRACHCLPSSTASTMLQVDSHLAGGSRGCCEMFLRSHYTHRWVILYVLAATCKASLYTLPTTATNTTLLPSLCSSPLRPHYPSLCSDLFHGSLHQNI